MACPSPLLSAILGKALRVSHIRQDSEWLYLLFGGCNWFFWWVQLIWWHPGPVCNTAPPVPILRCVWKRLLPSLRLSLSLQFLENVSSRWKRWSDSYLATLPDTGATWSAINQFHLFIFWKVPNFWGFLFGNLWHYCSRVSSFHPRTLSMYSWLGVKQIFGKLK